MKKKIIIIIIFVLFFVACDGLKTELDIDTAAFPPKLVVTAILDGASGTFSIVLTQGHSLADFKTSRNPDIQEIIVNGEIHLYEDGYLILSEIGEFDMTTSNQETYFDTTIWEWVYPDKSGYRFKASVDAKPGSTYRLVVKTDKHETVTSTSTMPLLPDVSATINTDEIVIKSGIKELNSLEGMSYLIASSGSGFEFWSVPLQWGNRPTGRNYYALEMFEEKTLIEGTPHQLMRRLGMNNIGIYISDWSKIWDNPEIEIFESFEDGLSTQISYYDTFLFPILLMSDISFTPDNASLTLLKYTERIKDFGENYPPEYFEGIVYHHSLSMRVRHITEATFNYYRSMTKQSAGMGFFTEPVNIIGNIENGYGCFNVFSAADIHLLEYESYEYRTINNW